MRYVQLYRREDNQWIAQFKAVQDLLNYVDKEDLNINDYDIRMEENKYPS